MIAQRRLPRRDRAARRRARDHDRPGRDQGLHLQGAEPRPLRLPLRDADGGAAHRQRHVRPDPGRARRGPAAGRPRVLRHAGRDLHRGGVRHRGRADRELREAARRAARILRLQRLGARPRPRQPLQAKVGETVRIFFGVGGPNKTSASTSSARSSTRSTRSGSLTAAPTHRRADRDRGAGRRRGRRVDARGARPATSWSTMRSRASSAASPPSSRSKVRPTRRSSMRPLASS